jgi:hypothetical protein
MNSVVTRTRLERLLDQRAALSRVHEETLALVESRPPEEAVPTEIERKQLDGYREKAVDLDREIGELNDVLEREEASVSASKKVRIHLMGNQPGVELVDGQPEYKTFGAFARDALITGAPGRGDVHIARNASALHNIASSAGGDVARAAAQERLTRTPVHTTSSDVAGLQPPQYMAQILDVIDSTRPVVATGTMVNLQRGVLTYPKITSRPAVALQGSEKSEGGAGTLTVEMASGTADSFIGGGNLSWQAMEWSTPDALDLWFRLAGEQYAIQTEGTACGVLVDAASGTITAPLVGGTADTFAKWLAAVLAGASAVYGNTRAMADTLWLSPDMFFEAAGLTATGGAQLITPGTLNVRGLSGTLGGLRVVVSAGFPPTTAIVGDSSAFIVAETPNSPVQLRAVEPAIGGLEVGLIGAFRAIAFDDNRFCSLT